MRPSQPGLDLNSLRALRSRTANMVPIAEKIRDHLNAHEGYLPFSGGKDSAAVLHMVLAVEPNVPVVFFDSGLEFPETYDYIATIADRYNVDLHIVPAKPSLLEILIASGRWDHEAPDRPVPNLGRILIETPAKDAHSSHGPGELWGVRAAEARGRAVAYTNALQAEITLSCNGCCRTSVRPSTAQRTAHGGIIRRTDCTVAFGPIWDWSTEQVWGYLAQHHVPNNPVYDKLRALGAPERSLRISHIIDGGNLDSGRITWLRRGWPVLFEQLATVLPRIREFV